MSPKIAQTFYVMRRQLQAIVLAVLLLILVLAQPVAAQQGRGPIFTVDVEGVVTSVTIGHLRRALHLAEAADATALIVRLSSSGAVLRDARAFAGEIASARVPVVVYVTPSGTEAGAAGAFFLSAAHIGALTPDTSFGSPYPLTQVDATLSQQTRDLVLDSVVDQLRQWNADRGRNTDWVDRAVREGVVLSNEQAAATQPPAVDLVAADQPELLTLLEGRVVKLADGRTVQLATLGRSLTPVEPTAWESLRLLLASPTVAFVLLVLGALAICLEFSTPGSTVFVGIGVVLLVAAALGLLVLPIRWWALLLLVLALGLIFAEFLAHAHGGLAVTGLGLLAAGALTLIDPAQAPGAAIALWVVLLVALVVATFVALGVWLALRSRDRPITTGQEAMVGKLAEVRQRLDPDGMVFVEGALWRALSEDGPAEAGDWVRVTAVHNLSLIVRRLDTEDAKRKT